MDYTFNKALLVILCLSSLLLSSNAVSSTRVIDFISTSVPAAAPKTKTPSSIDFISTSFSAEAPSSIVPDAPDDDDALIDYPYAPSTDPTFYNRVPESKICNKGPFDVVKALEIEVNTTGDMVKDIFDVIVKLRNNPSTDKRSKDAFDTCRDQYDMMLDLINQTLEILIPQQNFVDAYENMAALLAYKDTCGISLSSASPMVVMPWIYAMP
ncbi:pectinesterase inhibitor [Trifolium pratense]|uniref:Pectinesterase inhibitor n=1 Tax=Trifolium pratense TaxID=57577 RepID=A0A2K3NFE5_TRIPR|nr:pectinesterase inhibitor [Trifolium pratense]